MCADMSVCADGCTYLRVSMDVRVQICVCRWVDLTSPPSLYTVVLSYQQAFRSTEPNTHAYTSHTHTYTHTHTQLHTHTLTHTHTLHRHTLTHTHILYTATHTNTHHKHIHYSPTTTTHLLVQTPLTTHKQVIEVYEAEKLS